MHKLKGPSDGWSAFCSSISHRTFRVHLISPDIVFWFIGRLSNVDIDAVEINHTHTHTQFPHQCTHTHTLAPTSAPHIFLTPPPPNTDTSRSAKLSSDLEAMKVVLCWKQSWKTINLQDGVEQMAGMWVPTLFFFFFKALLWHVMLKDNRWFSQQFVWRKIAFLWNAISPADNATDGGGQLITHS